MRAAPGAVAALVLFAGLAYARAAQTERSAAPAHFSGTVFCSDTRKPARGAVVQLHEITAETAPEDQLRYSAFTDADGAFHMDGIKPGNYAVSFSLHGYYLPDPHPEPTPAAKISPSKPATSTQVPGASTQGPGGIVPPKAQTSQRLSRYSPTLSFHEQETISQTFTLEHGAVLSGRVSFSDGSPAVEAFLNVQNAVTFEPLPLYDLAFGPRRSDDRGRFRLFGLPPGRYLVSATIRSPFQPCTGPDLHIPPIFSPGTYHRGAAQVYTLEAGEEQGGVDITIPLATLRTVRGRVTGPGGTPVNMGEVMLEDTVDSTLTRRTLVSPEDGTFLFTGVQPGTYKLLADELFVGAPDQEHAGQSPCSMDNGFVRVHAYAPAGMTLIVGDSDLSEVVLVSPGEIALPAEDKP